MKRLIWQSSVLILWAVMLPVLAFSQNDSTSIKPFTIGESVEFYSTELEEKRTINVYLPASYPTDSTRKYNVIYLLDGSAEEDFIHISGLVQFGSYPWINMLPESIVIGISNVDRKHDFTFPTSIAKDKIDFPTSGGSENFMAFIEKELQPKVQEMYRTSSIKTIVGQSLGGLLATEILLKKPGLFDNYIIISPSLWWDDQSLLDFADVKISDEMSIFVGVGKEGKVMEKDAKVLYKKLKKVNSSNLSFKFRKELDHGDALHLLVYDAFEKLFPFPTTISPK
ncbi:MAG: putative alpha/beta superfamily hydrolase [Crocinitomicaceae bacterium]|jgi:predicted alpha/beta superfamily hydrolase